MKKKKTARKRKTAQKRKKIAYIYAILTEKKSVTYLSEIYILNIPKIVDKKTARYLRKTGLFKFERIKENAEV